MTLAFVVIAFFVAGFEFRQWWTVALPAVLGALAAVVLAASSHNLGDTPIPFLIVLGTIVATAGKSLSQRERVPRSGG